MTTDNAVKSQQVLRSIPNKIDVYKGIKILAWITSTGISALLIESPLFQMMYPNNVRISIGPCIGETLTGYLYWNAISSKWIEMATILPAQKSAN